MFNALRGMRGSKRVAVVAYSCHKDKNGPFARVGVGLVKKGAARGGALGFHALPRKSLLP